MKRLILFSCFGLLFICKLFAHKQSSASKTHSTNNRKVTSRSNNADKAIDLIERLPEVSQEEKLFYKNTKRHIVFTLENDPSKEGFYLIGVVQDMIDHQFHLWYFKVDSKMSKISIWDIPSDTMIPYSKWRIHTNYRKSKAKTNYLVHH